MIIKDVKRQIIFKKLSFSHFSVLAMTHDSPVEKKHKKKT